MDLDQWFGQSKLEIVFRSKKKNVKERNVMKGANNKLGSVFSLGSIKCLFKKCIQSFKSKKYYANSSISKFNILEFFCR